MVLDMANGDASCVFFLRNKNGIWESDEKSAGCGIFVKKELECGIRTPPPSRPWWYHAQPHPIIVYYHSTHCFFPSIGREPTTWPTNNWLQIMVCSCVVSFKCVLLQIIFCSCVIGTTLCREKCRSLSWATRKWLKYEKKKLCDRMIKQSLNSVIAKCRDLSVSSLTNRDILLNVAQ